MNILKAIPSGWGKGAGGEERAGGEGRNELKLDFIIVVFPINPRGWGDPI